LNGAQADPHGKLRFRGKFQEAEAVNKNKRMYPFETLDENVQRLQAAMKVGGLTGEIDHPTDSIVHLKDISHKVTKLWWEGNVLMGEGEVLTTPSGMVLRKLINDGVQIGISSRGVGNGRVNEDGILVIGESYKLITFDAVADPSTHQAYQKEVKGSQREHYVPKIQNNPSKIDSSRIYNPVASTALIKACLGGIVKSQTNEFKARFK
jgi:hypothetical protein